jgi:Zn-finger nucleic acid-binding protein
MLCPECPRRLERTERRGVAVWACRDCDGCATRIAELRKAVDRTQVEQLLQRARSPGAAWGKRCPECQKATREGRVRDARRLFVLDHCEPCDLLWFDVHELEDFVPAEEPEPTAASKPPATLPAKAPAPSNRRGKRRKKRRGGRRPKKPSSTRRRTKSTADVVAQILLDLLSGIING